MEAPTALEKSTFVSFEGWKSWLILSLLVASRLLMVILASSLSGDDGGRYLTEAFNVWAHGTFSTHSGAHPTPTAHDLPLFPIIMAAFIAVSKDPISAAKMTSLVNCILFGVAARAVYDLGWRLTGSFATATLAMLIFGCLPESFPYSVYYVPESLFLAFFVWSLVKFVQYLRSKNSRFLIQAFLLWGLSVLAKPISIFVGPLFAVVSVVLVLRGHKNLLNRISFTLLGLFLGIAVLVPWMVRNYIDFGLVGISSIIGTNPVYVNYYRILENQSVPNPGSGLSPKEAEATAKVGPERSNPMTRSVPQSASTAVTILGNIGGYFLATLKGSPRLYAGTGTLATLRMLGDTESVVAIENALHHRDTWRKVPMRALILQLVSWLCLAVTYVAAAAGIITMTRRRNWVFVGVIVGVLLYFAILIGPLRSTRYRITMLPALSVAAAIGLREEYRRKHGLERY